MSNDPGALDSRDSLRSIYPLVESDDAQGDGWLVTGLGNAIDNLEMFDHFLRMTDSPWRWKWVIIAAHQAMYTIFILALSKSAPDLTVTKQPEAAYAQMRSRQGWCIAKIAKDLTELNQNTYSQQRRLQGASEDEIEKELRSQEMEVTKEKVRKLLTTELKLIDIWEAKKRLSATEPNTGQPYNPARNDYLPWSNSRRLELSDAEEKAFERLVAGLRNQFEHFRPMTWFINPAHFNEMLTHVLRIIQFVALESNCIDYHREEQKDQIQRLIESIQGKLAQGA